MSAVGSLTAPDGRELMCTSAPLLGNVSDGGPTLRDLRAMARMLHTGVPLADVAFIFGISPAQAYWCVCRYVWAWRFGIGDYVGGKSLSPRDSTRKLYTPCSM